LFAVLLTCTPAVAADNDAAKAKFEACTACHNENGISTTENIPSLAGQLDRYLQWQLVYFRGGTRKSEIMNPIAEALSNEDIRDLGAYVAHLPAPEAAAAEPSDLIDKGRALAAQNRCASCHGEKLEGNGSAAKLSGQRQDYLLKALQDFKAGKRVGGGMAAMADVVYPLSADDLPALAAYAASVR
jgi:cytochrome c553